ncbi:unnamed protein product [Candidula unifasciata]|uniref:Zinc finger CCCH domain-containing protein 14 n=1 Tax=Candidula unifasciata TaxID=100452 RepID=A0A8S4A885_9EUPU|nr:unnamed protein product [Candidula unifasciata]
MSVMEVGTEISQKIRSAIKAKLVELGSYVDDELPDYIMVMVANKKTRAQMNGDLGLFLGTSTVAFTDWLHGLLEKLQTIRIEPEPHTDKHDKSDKVKAKEKKKDHKKSHKGDTSHSSGKKKDKHKKKDIESVVSDDVNATVLDNIGTAATSNISESQEETKIGSETQQEKSPIKDNSVSEDFEDVRQLLVTEAAEDELTNELETTEVEIIHARTVKNTAKPVAKSSQDIITTASSGRLPKQNPERRNIQKVSEVLRKRRAALTSVVAAISQNDEDEEYDPRNPAVASVVRVTARKSSVPPLLQANRVLLMKAMSEAERSVATKKRIAVAKPVSRDDSPSEVYSPKRKRDKSRDLDSPPPYIPSKKDNVGRQSSSSSQRVLSRNDARHMIKRDNGRQPPSRSYRDIVQTTNHSPDSEHRIELSRSPERSRRQPEDDRHVQSVSSEKIEKESKNDKNSKEITSKQIVREVKNDKNIRQVTSDRNGDKNIQITCHLVSDSRPSVPHVERKRQHSLSPEPKKPLQVTVYPPQNTKPTASRLGKIIIKRNNSDGDERESTSTRGSHAMINTSKRDAREDIVAKAAQSKSKENLSQKNNSGPVISNVGKEAVQKQCEAAVISVQAAQISTRAKRNISPDSRVVECDTQSNEDAKVEHDSRDHKEQVKKELISEKRRSSTHGLDETAKNRSSDSVGDDDDDDLSKMIDEDLGPELLDDTNGDDFNLDLDIDDDLSKVAAVGDEPLSSDVHEITKDDNKRGTRFIVTLDGVDERHFQSEDKGSNFDKFKNPAPVLSAPAPSVVAPVVATGTQQMHPDPSLYLRLLGVPPSTVSQALLQQVHAAALTVPSKLTPPKIQPFSISLKDSDDEHDEKEAKPPATQEYYQQAEGDVSAIKRAKMSERCKFWPACAAGSSCEYHHPTAHCKTFPNCKFGDRCLFIHPNCRFDSKCTRPDCPYTHTSRRPALASATHVIAIPKSHFVFSTVPPKSNFAGHPSSQGICRFFPNCHNMNCVFMHPKPCKFGLACKSPACPFFHPQVPAVDKLKWQASSAPAKTEVMPAPSKVEQIVDKHSPSTTSNLATVSSTSQ